jgi:hypothetical protein
MKKKNLLTIKWMLGILIILMAVAYWTNQQTPGKGRGLLPAASSVSSPNNFFQFLADFLGMGRQRSSSGELMPTTQSQPSPTRGHDTRSVPKQVAKQESAEGESTSGEQPSAEQDNADNNPASNSESNANNGSGNGEEKRSEINAENNPETNAEANPENNPQINAENNPETNAETNPENNPQINAENNPGSNAETNPENNPGNNLGGSSGNSSGNNPGCIPQCFPECKPECISANTPSNLPTINPIPSNNAASQNIARQNQQSDTLAALEAANQALAAKVMQSAQATKYQTVSSDSIPPTDTTPAPQDIVDKIKSAQLIQH